MSLQENLKLVQDRISAQFAETRRSYEHSGNKGSNVEKILRDFIAKYIPPSYRLGEGEIIDSFGSVSRQIDIVVCNEYQPFWGDLSSPTTFIVEGVAAAGEVKTILNSSELESTLHKCASVQNLNSVKPEGMQAKSTLEGLQRYYDNRPYFLFAFESALSIDTISQKIQEFNRSEKIPFEKQIDAVFILDRGTIINYGLDSGVHLKTAAGEKLKGYYYMELDRCTPISDLLVWFSGTVLRVEHPVPPITHYLT